MKHLDVGLAAAFADPDQFAIHVQVVTNSVESFTKYGAVSELRREAFTEETWQRIEWASRALLSALSEAKPIKPKKPRQLAHVVKLSKPAEGATA